MHDKCRLCIFMLSHMLSHLRMCLVRQVSGAPCLWAANGSEAADVFPTALSHVGSAKINMPYTKLCRKMPRAGKEKRPKKRSRSHRRGEIEGRDWLIHYYWLVLTEQGQWQRDRDGEGEERERRGSKGGGTLLAQMMSVTLYVSDITLHYESDCVCVCVCVCMYARVREKEGRRGLGGQTVHPSQQHHVKAPLRLRFWAASPTSPPPASTEVRRGGPWPVRLGHSLQGTAWGRQLYSTPSGGGVTSHPTESNENELNY